MMPTIEELEAALETIDSHPECRDVDLNYLLGPNLETIRAVLQQAIEIKRGENQWATLSEKLPLYDKEFVCRHKDTRYIQFEALITLESDGYESPDGGKPYPVLWDANSPDGNLLTDDWRMYEWMPIPEQENNNV